MQWTSDLFDEDLSDEHRNENIINTNISGRRTLINLQNEIEHLQMKI